MIRIYEMGIAILLLVAPLSARENPFLEDGQLKQNVIANAYYDGDLDFVRDALERFLKTKGDDGKITDRVLAYRYLGVIYGADSHTESKAKDLFLRLFALAPNSEVLDLYPPEKTLELFISVRNNHRISKTKAISIASSSSNKTSTNAELKNSNHIWVWALAGTAIAAGTVGFYLFLQSDKNDGGKNLVAE